MLSSIIQSKIFYRSLLKKLGRNVHFGKRLKLRGLKNISISNNVVLNEDVWIEAINSYNGVSFSPSIDILENVSIGRGSVITSINNIEIGKGSLLGPNVFITDHFHGKGDIEESDISPIKRNLFSKSGVKIGVGVWIGYGTVILPGVKVGDFAIIGANSVVTKNIDPHTVVGGNPAKLIRKIK